MLGSSDRVYGTVFLFKLFRAVEAFSHGKFALFTQLLKMYHVIMNLSLFSVYYAKLPQFDANDNWKVSILF